MFKLFVLQDTEDSADFCVMFAQCVSCLRSQVTRPLSYTKRQFDVEEEDVDKLALRWANVWDCVSASVLKFLRGLTVCSVFRVDLWNASNLKFGDEFLGGVRVPLRVLGQAGVHDAWWEEHRSHVTSSFTRNS